jgi:hypothetical protein
VHEIETPATPGLPEWRVTRLSKPARGVDEFFFPNVNNFTVLDRFRIYFMKVDRRPPWKTSKREGSLEHL